MKGTTQAPASPRLLGPESAFDDEATRAPWQMLVNLYVSLRSKRRVILRMASEEDVSPLTDDTPTTTPSRPKEQGCLQAHPWWVARTAAPAFWAMTHAQFNALKVMDLIDLAAAHESSGRPFVLGLERMSPADLLCYFEHLPAGAFWLPDGSTVTVRLPENLYLVGTLGPNEHTSPLLEAGVYRHATVLSMPLMGRAVWKLFRELWSARVDWQQGLHLSVRTAEDAMDRLAHILPDGVKPLAPLAELAGRLGLPRLPRWLLDDAWLYLANAFGPDRAPLFGEDIVENLALAQDLFLSQTGLPYLLASGAGVAAVWAIAQEYLSSFPKVQLFLKDLFSAHPYQHLGGQVSWAE